MAEPTSAAPAAAPIPSSADIARAEKLVRERFVHPGEDPTVALAPGQTVWPQQRLTLRPRDPLLLRVEPR